VDILIFRNGEGVDGQRQVGNSWVNRIIAANCYTINFARYAWWIDCGIM